MSQMTPMMKMAVRSTSSSLQGRKGGWGITRHHPGITQPHSSHSSHPVTNVFAGKAHRHGAPAIPGWNEPYELRARARCVPRRFTVIDADGLVRASGYTDTPTCLAGEPFPLRVPAPFAPD